MGFDDTPRQTLPTFREGDTGAVQTTELPSRKVALKAALHAMRPSPIVAMRAMMVRRNPRRAATGDTVVLCVEASSSDAMARICYRIRACQNRVADGSEN